MKYSRSLFVASILTLCGTEYVLHRLTVVGSVTAISDIDNLLIIPFLPLETFNRTTIFTTGQVANLVSCASKSTRYYVLQNNSGIKFSIQYGNYPPGYFVAREKIRWSVERGSLLNFNKGLVWFCPSEMENELLNKI
jgi:hypothetical protein